MKTATIKEIKIELENLPPSRLLEVALKLARFKKENKELITYLLFEAHDEPGYIAGVKETLHLLFTEVNVKNLYITKKNLRKIIRIGNRYIKYSSDLVTEVEVLIYIAEEIRQLDIDLTRSTALHNIYLSLEKKINRNISLLHEDLQYDYIKKLQQISTPG